MLATPGAISSSISDILLGHAQSIPGKTAFTFLRDGEDIDSELTYLDLFDQAHRIAGYLAACDLTGKAVVLFHPPGREFIAAFCGCLMAGVVAVPLHPITSTRLLDRAQKVLEDCSAAAILTTAARLAEAENLVTAHLRLIATDRLDAIAGISIPDAIPSTSAAVLQYTSGSTGSPKGVVITHGNLIANSTLIGQAFGTRPNDVGVNWLPLLHDMGLVGCVIHVIHYGIHCVHMSPQAMVRRPVRWLRAISRFRATVSGGPDFAWRLLCDRVREVDCAGLDLSSWRVAFTGAEQVRSSTLNRAAELLKPIHFDETSFLPCYGLAEATLIVSGGPGGALPLVSRKGAADQDAATYIGCGRPAAEDSVAIVNPTLATRLSDGQVGEIWVTGTHVAAGYWRRATETAQVFHARLTSDPRMWLRTGDLGFINEGQLHITGRINDLLNVNGRKHHPEDLEATVQDRVPACVSGVAAAFQAEVNGLLRLVLAVELVEQPEDQEAYDTVANAVRAAIWSQHEVLVDAVVVLRTGRLPRTTSGKVKRSETRDLWIAGKLVTGISYV